MPIREISVTELADLRATDAVVVDVRNPDEYLEARVPGVMLIPLPEFAERADEIPAADTVYVICRSGARSMKACEVLVSQGRDAVNVAGGTLAWIDSGGAVASGPDGA